MNWGWLAHFNWRLCLIVAVILSSTAVAPEFAYSAPKQKKQAVPKSKPVTKKERTNNDNSPARNNETKAEKGESSSNLKREIAGSGSENQPVLISSDSLKLDAKERVFTYYDHVKVVKGDLTITADKVTGRYDSSNQIERILCDENVVITRGETIKASSNHADYDVKKGVIVMTEAPELNDRGNVLNADKVTIYVNEDRSEAEGHVRVKVIKNEAGLLGNKPN